MKTLVDIDESLLRKAMTVSSAPTKKETIRQALVELVRARQRQSLKAMAGSALLDMTLPELRRARHGTTRQAVRRRRAARSRPAR